MKILSKFVLSLLSLPILIPWFLSEKLFQVLLQPLLFRKYQAGQISRKRRPFRYGKYLLPALLFLYLVKIAIQFAATQGSVLAALRHSRVVFFMVYNDTAALLNFFFKPLNTVLLYMQGSQIDLLEVLYAFYLLFLPVIVLSNIAFCLLTTRVTLQKAVHMRNQAVRDVDIVRFAEAAADEEIFLGLDLTRSSQPFYAKFRWLMGHIQVIGAPGSGKTESIIQPLWFQCVRRNIPTIVLDGKASRRNIDRFYTIATSLAQGSEVIYFNPEEPRRSASYNPLRHGTPEEIKNRILFAINWTKYAAHNREKLERNLDSILQAIRATGTAITLPELVKYFDSRQHVYSQINRISEPALKNSLQQILANYDAFQTESAFFTMLLLQLCHSKYGHLLSAEEPELDLHEVYAGNRDCYFTLPIGPEDSAMKFLGQLILGDIQSTFHYFSLHGDAAGSSTSGGLLIIDELAKFVSPHFVELLRVSRNLGVSVCYTNQSLTELEDPELHLSRTFTDQLAAHTNVTFGFNISGPETVQALVQRMGLDTQAGASAATAGDVAQEEAMPGIPSTIFENLDIGRCVLFIRQPRMLNVLKTGYFKFDKLLEFGDHKFEPRPA